MRERSMHTPPRTAVTLPSRPVPVPKATTGTRWRAQALTIADTSSLDSAKATASGGIGVWYDSSLPCCARTD